MKIFVFLVSVAIYSGSWTIVQAQDESDPGIESEDTWADDLTTEEAPAPAKAEKAPERPQEKAKENVAQRPKKVEKPKKQKAKEVKKKAKKKASHH